MYIDYLWILNQIENNEMLEYLNNDENTQLNATYRVYKFTTVK